MLGIRTTLPFFERVLRHPDFVAGDFDTSFVETALAPAPTARERPSRRRSWRRRSAPSATRQRAAARASGPAADGSPWRLAGRREAQRRLGG